MMKQYMLLPDQQIITNKNPLSFSTLPDGDPNINFSDQEDKLNDADLADARDEALELELALADRKCKKEIRHLENELPRWTVLVDSITGIGIHPEFDNITLAVLRGRLVRYLMRSREVSHFDGFRLRYSRLYQFFVCNRLHWAESRIMIMSMWTCCWKDPRIKCHDVKAPLNYEAMVTFSSQTKASDRFSSMVFHCLMEIKQN